MLVAFLAPVAHLPSHSRPALALPRDRIAAANVLGAERVAVAHYKARARLEQRSGGRVLSVDCFGWDNRTTTMHVTLGHVEIGGAEEISRKASEEKRKIKYCKWDDVVVLHQECDCGQGAQLEN